MLDSRVVYRYSLTSLDINVVLQLSGDCTAMIFDYVTPNSHEYYWLPFGINNGGFVPQKTRCTRGSRNKWSNFASHFDSSSCTTECNNDTKLYKRREE